MKKKIYCDKSERKMVSFNLPPRESHDFSSSAMSCSSVSTSSTVGSGSSGHSSGGFPLPRMFQRKAKDKSKIEASDENSVSTSATPPPPIWNDEIPINTGSSSGRPPMAPIPKYKDTNRMLMRSPLPSPKQGLHKIIRPRNQKSNSSSDSESEDGRQKREDSAVSRLVQMAKQQQDFAMAWFATSNGEDPMLPALATTRKSRPRRKSGNRKAIAVPTVTAPIDIDSGEEYGCSGNDDASQSGGSISSTISNGSSKMRAFLTGILSKSSTANARSETPVTSNTSNDDDFERGDIRNTSTNGTNSFICRKEPSDDRNTGEECTMQSTRVSGMDHGHTKQKAFACTTKRPVILVLLLLAIIAVATAATLYTKAGRQDRENVSINTENPSSERVGEDIVLVTPSFSPVPSLAPSPPAQASVVTGTPSISHVLPTPFPSISPTPLPTIGPSAYPSVIPSTVPSYAPTYVPTFVPSDLPSTIPSVMPTREPSASPTMAPSLAPSAFPSSSIAPSTFPSSSPSTEFSTTIFESSVGSTLLGELDKEGFGYSISMSANGAVLAVGALNHEVAGKIRAGKVQVFELSPSSSWIPRGQPIFGRNTLDQFGFSVSLSSDGTRLAASEPGYDGLAGDRSGNVRIYDWDEGSGSWTLVGEEVGGEAATDYFGYSIALSGDGSRLVSGAPYHDNNNGPRKSGRVRVLEYSSEDETWNYRGDAMDGTGQLDWFGHDVDLSEDGQTIAIGAPRNGGYVRCFGWNEDGENWIQVGDDIVDTIGNVQLNDRFGMVVSLSSNGNRIAIGAPWKDETSSKRNSGFVAVYQRNASNSNTGADDASTSTWSMLGEAHVGEGTNHQLGWSLHLSGSDGEYLSIGIPGQEINRGKVTFHRWNGLIWDTISKPLEGEREMDSFGFSVAVSADGSTVAVGASQNSGGTGYAKVFRSI